MIPATTGLLSRFQKLKTSPPSHLMFPYHCIQYRIGTNFFLFDVGNVLDIPLLDTWKSLGVDDS